MGQGGKHKGLKCKSSLKLNNLGKQDTAQQREDSSKFGERVYKPPLGYFLLCIEADATPAAIFCEGKHLTDRHHR